MPPRARKPTKKPSSETPWVKHLLKAFCWVPGVLVWRQNAGKIVLHGASGVRAIKLAPRGAADITGVGPGGIHIEIECKMAKGKDRAAQLRWAARMERLGAVHFAAWYDDALSVEANIAAQVERLRAEIAARGGASNARGYVRGHGDDRAHVRDLLGDDALLSRQEAPPVPVVQRRRRRARTAPHLGGHEGQQAAPAVGAPDQGA